MKGFAEVVEIPETKKDEKYIFGTIKNNGDSSYVTFDGSDFLTPITSAMGYEDGDRVMVMVKSHRAIVVNNMTSPAVTGKYVKENYASFENLSATNAQIGYLRANMITADVLEAKIGEFGYLKADQADLKFAAIETLNATNAEISTLKATTIKTDNLSAEVAKLGYAEIKDLNAATGRIDTLESSMITVDNLQAEIAKIGYLTADEADIRYLTASTADAKFLHADMSDMDIAKIQTLFATAGIVSDMIIKDGHITGELSGIKVSANDISAGRLDAATIEVVNLNAANITVGTINGTQIATGAIDLTKLGSDVTDKLADTEDDVAKAVADAKKAITDSATAQNTANSATSTANSALSTANSATSTANAANSLASTAKSTADSANSSAANAVNIANGISVGGRNLIQSNRIVRGVWLSDGGNENSHSMCMSTGFISVKPGDSIILQYWQPKNNNEGNNRAWSGLILYFDTDKHYVSGYISTWFSNEHMAIAGVVPSDCYYIRATYQLPINSEGINASNWNQYSSYKWKLELGNRATDWTPAPEDVDSSINTASIKNWCYNGNLAWMNGAKIYANTIVSDAIAADAITAVKIKAGAITADKIAANSVTAGKIAANAVTAGTIAAGSITTDKISANAVSADKIATNAVTADKILAKSITAAKIAAGTITSDEIASNAVTAAKINVSSLSAISANIGTVTAGTIQSNNYVKDVSGMKLSLTDGSWDSKYTKIDASGKITCSNIGITGGSIDLTGDTGDTVLVNIKKGNTTLKLSPNGIDQRNYNGNASASGLKSETRIMSLKNRRIEINDTQAYSTYDIFSSVVIDIMAHADGGKTSLELHDNNGSTRVLTSSMLTSKELSFSNNKKTWTVGISGTIPELLVSCDSTKILKVTGSGIEITGDITTSSGASLNTINSNLAQLSDDKVLKSNRGWYPNGKSLYSVHPGVYSTNPNASPGSLGGLNPYGTLLVLRENSYQTAIYMSVVGQMAFWASNSNAWAIVRS